MENTNHNSHNDSPLCPKCKNIMTQGILVEYKSINYISMNLSTPKALSWATRVFGDFWSGYNTENEKQVISYRCQSCGYLENYAK